MGGATTETVDKAVEDAKFQSTRPVGGATGLSTTSKIKRSISIHAPRGGRDGIYSADGTLDHYISIHAPRGGRDGVKGGYNSRVWQFQSTRPVGGATCAARRTA